jgi:hypothetical protein
MIARARSGALTMSAHCLAHFRDIGPSVREQRDACGSVVEDGGERWFSSWASDAVASPSVVTRLTCASFDCASRNFSSL